MAMNNITETFFSSKIICGEEKREGKAYLYLLVSRKGFKRGM